MRNTLIIGVLLCLPVAVLLASASLTVLASNLYRRFSGSAGPGTVLPDADRIAGRIPGHGHPQVTLGVRRRGHFPAGLLHLGQGLVDVRHVDVGNDTGLTGYRQVGHEVPDEVAGAVGEGGAARPDRPAERRAVETRRTRGVRSGDAQVRHVTRAEHRDLRHTADLSWPDPGRVYADGHWRSR